MSDPTSAYSVKLLGLYPLHLAPVHRRADREVLRRSGPAINSQVDQRCMVSAPPNARRAPECNPAGGGMRPGGRRRSSRGWRTCRSTCCSNGSGRCARARGRRAGRRCAASTRRVFNEYFATTRTSFSNLSMVLAKETFYLKKHQVSATSEVEIVDYSAVLMPCLSQAPGLAASRGLPTAHCCQAVSRRILGYGAAP